VARKFLTAIDLSKNELQNGVVQNLASAPSSPSKGQLYFNSTAGDNTLYWWDGTAWVPAKASSSVPLSGSVSDLVPGNANNPGAGTTASKGDHVHGLPAFAAVSPSTSFGQAASNGVAGTFIRSDHVHGTPTHDAAAHSTIPLNALAVATGNYNMGGFTLTGLPGSPSGLNDATSKQYVDSIAQGLAWKDSVRAATTTNITLSGTQTIDGVAVVVGDRVLVKNQTTTANNGVYVVASGAWTRSTDMDTGTEFPASTVYVEEGTTLADTAWVCTTNNPVTVGTTAITFAQSAGAGTYSAGAGLVQNGNAFDVGAGTGITVAADSIALDTTYTDGRYVNTTGADSMSGKLTANGGIDSNSLSTFSGGLRQAVDPNPAIPTDVLNVKYLSDYSYVRKYAAALTGTVSPETVTHNLNTRDVDVRVVDSSYTMVDVDWDATTVNTVTLRFNPVLGAGYRVMVMG